MAETTFNSIESLRNHVEGFGHPDVDGGALVRMLRGGSDKNRFIAQTARRTVVRLRSSLGSIEVTTYGTLLLVLRIIHQPDYALANVNGF